MMRALLTAALSVTVCAGPVWSQASRLPHVTTRPPLRERAAIDSARVVLLEGMRRSGIPGAAVTVMRDGHIIWSEGLGFADAENRVPVTTLTRFRIGSVSKPLATAALGVLIEEGKLDLDAPVQRYVPSFPAKRYPFTVRQLAGHLAGVRHYGNAEEFLSKQHYGSVSDALSIFRNDSLQFRPGEKYGYSTFGYVLLSAVIEGAAGEPFISFMRRRVIDPIGMSRTVPEYPDSIIPGRARFYSRKDSLSPIHNAPYVNNSNKWAGGGYLSTTEDLALFGHSMSTAGLLKRKTTDVMWTSMRTADGKPTDYGIGWSVNTDSAGRRTISHSGGSVGGTAMLVIHPEERLVFAFLFNSDQRQPPLRRAMGFFLRPHPGPAARSTLQPQTGFWTTLQTLCGRAFAGTLTEGSAADSTFRRSALTMHVRECTPSTVRIPLHAGADRSRTWVLTRTDTGLRLKHDHRHGDGSEDRITQYGGDTQNTGTATKQEFFADEHTALLIPAARTNVWTVEIIA
ncbi:MAG TPA: serine hydrolase domain-containing protein, partial [Gemmatimonadaceae bacterium]|nr:serine hydrolase domain-containing protein [Gemmatimonadaceae bacterium]